MDWEKEALKAKNESLQREIEYCKKVDTLKEGKIALLMKSIKLFEKLNISLQKEKFDPEYYKKYHRMFGLFFRDAPVEIELN